MTQALARAPGDQCDDAFCVFVRGHDGPHDPPFDDPETDADRARRAAEEARAQQLADARARPIAHVAAERVEQAGLFG